MSCKYLLFLLFLVSLIVGGTAVRLSALAPIEPERIGPPREKKEAPEEVSEPQDGYYVCKGPVGDNEYECVVMIRKVSRDAYVVKWSSSGPSYIGIGRMENKKFVVGWSGTGVTGLSVYQPERDEADKLTWAGKQLMVPGTGALIDESLEFLRPLKKAK